MKEFSQGKRIKRSEEFPDAHDTCMLPSTQSSCHLGQWCLVGVVSISTGIHGDDPVCDALHQRGHLPERGAAMPRGHCPWDLSGFFAFAPTVIFVPGVSWRTRTFRISSPRNRGANRLTQSTEPIVLSGTISFVQGGFIPL